MYIIMVNEDIHTFKDFDNKEVPDEFALLLDIVKNKLKHGNDGKFNPAIAFNNGENTAVHVIQIKDQVPSNTTQVIYLDATNTVFNEDRSTISDDISDAISALYSGDGKPDVSQLKIANWPTKAIYNLLIVESTFKLFLREVPYYSYNCFKHESGTKAATVLLFDEVSEAKISMAIQGICNLYKQMDAKIDYIGYPDKSQIN